MGSTEAHFWINNEVRKNSNNNVCRVFLQKTDQLHAESDLHCIPIGKIKLYQTKEISYQSTANWFSEEEYRLTMVFWCYSVITIDRLHDG